MSLEMGAVDHEGPGSGAFPSQGLEDAVEDPGLAPAHSPVSRASALASWQVSSFLMLRLITLSPW